MSHHVWEKEETAFLNKSKKQLWENISENVFMTTEMNSNQSKNNIKDSNFVSEHLGREVFSMFKILRKSNKIDVPGPLIYNG